MGKHINPNPRVLPPISRQEYPKHRLPVAGDYILVNYSGVVVRVTTVEPHGFFGVVQLARTSQLEPFEDMTNSENVSRARFWDFSRALELIQAASKV